MPDFFMGLGCERDADCGGVTAGQCRSNVCECVEDRFGLRCEYSHTEVCSEVQLDGRFEPVFPSVRQLSTSYSVVSNKATAYERPIFYNVDTDDVILFTGVRWAITSRNGIIPTGTTSPNVSTDVLLQSLDDGTFFAGDIASIDMMSLPLPYQTFDDRLSTPIDTEWEIVPIPGSLGDIDLVPTGNPVQMLCRICNDDNNPCSFGNTCSENGQCICDDRSTGALCQLPPIGDGHCDEKFNLPEFEYDGGDCCSETCVGSECGLTVVGSIPNIRIGFPYCKDPSVLSEWTNPSLSRYIRNSKPIEALSSEGTMVPTLSANGEVLVVGEPDIGVVRVFDLIESEWKQRGRTLRGLEGSNFGSIAAISTPEAGIVSSPTGLLPVMLAIGEPSTGYIWTYDWPRGAVDWWTAPSIRVMVNIGLVEVSGIFPGARLLMSFWYGDPVVGEVKKNVTVAVDNGFQEGGHQTNSNRGCIFTRTITPSSSNSFEGGCSSSTFHGSISPGGNRIIKATRIGPMGDVLEEIIAEIVLFAGDYIVTSGRSSSLHGNFTPPGTSIVHLADASTPITNPQHPLLRGRGYTMVLESPSMMNTTNVTLLYRPDIGAGENASRLNTGESNVARSLLLHNGVALSDTVSSRDGTAVTTTFSNGTALTFVLRSDRSRWVEISMEGVSYNTSSFSAFGSALSISDGARHLTASRPGLLQTYSINTPVCDSNEVTVRLVIHFDGSPAQVSWEVFSQAGEGKGKIFASCTNCYEWSRYLYSWTTISKDICVPRASLGCIGLTVESAFVLDIYGFAAYVINDDSVTLVASDNGAAVDGSKVYSLNDTVANGGCDSTDIPSRSPSREPSAPPSISYAPTVSPTLSFAPPGPCVDDGSCREGWVFDTTQSGPFSSTSVDDCRRICAGPGGAKGFTFAADVERCYCPFTLCFPTFDYDIFRYGTNVTSGPI